MIAGASSREVLMAEKTLDEREWRVAKVVESNEEAILIAGFLNSAGIPAQVESLHVEELPVNLGAMGEVRVRVPADRLGEAEALLEQSDEQAAAAGPMDLDDQAATPATSAGAVPASPTAGRAGPGGARRDTDER